MTAENKTVNNILKLIASIIAISIAVTVYVIDKKFDLQMKKIEDITDSTYQNSKRTDDKVTKLYKDQIYQKEYIPFIGIIDSKSDGNKSNILVTNNLNSDSVYTDSSGRFVIDSIHFIRYAEIGIKIHLGEEIITKVYSLDGKAKNIPL